MKRTVCLLFCGYVLFAGRSLAGAEEFTNAIRALLADHVDLEKKSAGVVVGIIDEHGASVVSWGRADDGASAEVNGETVFEIGSITKTFTGLLLQDMVERGEMNLNDPVAKYLPASARVPAHNGSQITLLHLATHTSGLPLDPENLTPESWKEPYAGYSMDKLLAFLSGFEPPYDPGTGYRYSNVGMALLADAITRRAGTNFEALVQERICEPLGMGSTRIVLTPAMAARRACGHGWFGKPEEDMVFAESLCGAGALHSTVNDLLKYLAANLGFTTNRLTRLMEKTHEVSLQGQAPGWGVSGDWVSKNGGTLGFTSTITMDMKRRRGVVALSNKAFDMELPSIGAIILRSEWQATDRPGAVNLKKSVLEARVGQYRQGANITAGIRSEGGRLFLQLDGQPLQEILPESESTYFTRMGGRRLTFDRNKGGSVAELVMEVNGAQATLARISSDPPETHRPPKPPVFVRGSAETMAEWAGEYRLPSGKIVQISPKGDHLEAHFEKWMAFEMWPESAVKFGSDALPLDATFEGDGGKDGSVMIRCPLFDAEFTGKASRIGR